MTQFRSILFAAVCLAAFFAAPAQSQVFTVSTYTGNGQMICSGCPNTRFQQFEPLTAKVVDQNGNPAAGVSVTWFPALGGGAITYAQTVTDNNGLTQNIYAVNVSQASPTNPFVSNQIQASVGNSTATFYETQALSTPQGSIPEQVYFTSVPVSVSGSAGSPATAIVITAAAFNILTPGVEVRLLNNQTSPSISCATGPGADPGTVLTDTTGTATCNPILSGSGSGSFTILVGGVAVSQFAEFTGQPIGWTESNPIQLSVTAPVPGSVQVVSGNNQTVTAGQSLPSFMVAQVKDVNGNPMTQQAVTWSVSPSTAGVLNNTISTTNANGQVQSGLTLTASASGNVTITVSLPGNTSIKTTFTVNAIPLITYTSLQKLTGDGQTAISGQPFANPLAVQLSVSGGSAAGATVNFSVTGPATLSTTAPQTDANGRAQVTVVAGTTSSQATVTVTATVTNLPAVTFQLTVLPPGPNITATSFVNAADQKVGSVSPCSLAMVSGPGLAPNIQGTLIGAAFGAGPLTLSGDSISVSGVQAPIFSVSNIGGQQSATFQVPCEVTPSGGNPVVITVGGGTATVNVPVLAASPGIYTTVGTDGQTRALLVRQDGSFVSLQNPARHGETVTAFVTGLGPTSPQVGTNQLPPRGTSSTVIGTVVPGLSGGGATLTGAKLTADLVGVYEVSFTIPAGVSSGNNIGFSIGLIPVGSTTTQYSNLSFIPIATQ